MSSVKLRPWDFDKGEEVRLHWLCSPHRDNEGRWRVKAIFVTEGCPYFHPIDFSWGTLPLLRMGRSYVDGLLLKNDPRFKPQKLFNYDFQNGTLCDATKLPYGMYNLFGNAEFNRQKIWKFFFRYTLHFIPCTEFLRAFLTPTKFLTNQILKPNGLDLLFDEVEEKNNVLEIALSSEVPLRLVNNETVAHLVWLKYNKTARRCWESVYNNVFAKAIALTPQQPTSALATGLTIELKPPVEKSCELYFNGIKSRRNCLILELIGAKKLTLPPFEKIIYSHPSLSKRGAIEGAKKRRRAQDKDKDENFELDAQSRTVKTDVGQPVIRTIATTFGFKNPPKFEKVAKRESMGFQGELEQTTTPSAIGHGTKPDHSSNIVNTDESQYGGEIQPVDFQGVDLVAPADAAGLEKFTEAIERIAANHSQPQQRLNFIEVPGEKSCCRHANGSKRACAVVEVTQESIVTCYILELARVDGKSTSTLFFCLLSQPDSKNGVGGVITGLLEEFVKRDGHWNVEKLEQNSNLKARRLKHVSNQSANNWSRRILEKLVNFGFAPVKLKQ